MTRGKHTDDARHLVNVIRGPVSLPDLRVQLQEAHDYLAAAAISAVPGLVGNVRTWGAMTKRQRVRLIDPRPLRVSAHVREHNFVEVVNQCATLERLIDAISWAEATLTNHTVKLCNPTTSSSRTEVDHDLVLVDTLGALAKFEVSDIVSGTDGNKKETKDLESLNVLTQRKRDATMWPEGRVFLVVSPEFAGRLRRPNRHGLKRGSFHYREFEIAGCATRIFEIVRGRSGIVEGQGQASSPARAADDVPQRD